MLLRHAARTAIDCGKVSRAEALIRESRFSHLLDPPPEAMAAAAQSADSGPIATVPRDAAASAAAAMDGSPAAGGGGGAAAAEHDAAGGASGRGHSAAGVRTAEDAAADVHLHLSCQKFVELLRGGRVDEAVVFCREVCKLGR